MLLASVSPSRDMDPPASVRELPAVRPPPYGMGKRATTILADQGDFVTVVSDVPYYLRRKHVPPPLKKGTRPMHTSTLGIKTQLASDYQTTLQTVSGLIDNRVYLLAL